MSNWWYATSVDVTNGSDLVRVNTGDAARYFERGSCWLKIAGHEAVETDGLITDGADTFIRLVKDWAGETDTGRRAFAFRTVPDFQGVADKLALNIEASQEVVDNVISKIGTVLTSDDESIVIETAEGDVEVVPYGRLKADIEQQFNEFVDARQQQIDEATSKVNLANLRREFDERCTLVADFVNNRYRIYDGISAGQVETKFTDLFTFTRGTPKTASDAIDRLRAAPENTPVFSWKRGIPRGIGVHGQNTNLLTLSEDFSSWSKISSGSGQEPLLEAVQAKGPEGQVTTVYRGIVEVPVGDLGSSTNYSLLRSPNVNLSVSGAHSNASIFVKSNTSESYIITFYSNSDLSHVVEVYPDRWTRIDQSEDAASSSRSIILGVRGNTADDKPSPYADILITAAQITETKDAVPYIKTNGTQETRMPDNLRIMGISESSWFNPTEGTFVFEFELEQSDIGSNNLIFALTDGTVSNYMQLLGNSQSNRVSLIIRNGFGDGIISSNLTATPTLIKGKKVLIAIRFSSIEAAISVSGSEPIKSDLSGQLPLNLMNTADIGHRLQGFHTASNFYTIKYSPQAVSDELLQNLSAGTDND